MDVVRFILFEVHKADELIEYDRFKDYDRMSMDVLLDSIKSFADQELFPYFKEMDEKPARFVDGQVVVHPQVEKVIEKAAELGLLGPAFDYDLAHSGKGKSHGWTFFTTYNTELKSTLMEVSASHACCTPVWVSRISSNAPLAWGKFQ